MGILALKVMKLRDRTGCGIMDCKEALIETDGDIDVAQELLRLMSQAVSRRKNVDGVLFKWNVDDYLKEAYRIVDERNNCPHGYNWDDCPDCNH